MRKRTAANVLGITGMLPVCEESVWCEKTHLLHHLMPKIIVLPSQVRDKHRENSKREMRFSQGRPALHHLYKVLRGIALRELLGLRDLLST
jgi:hypothetical protein